MPAVLIGCIENKSFDGHASDSVTVLVADTMTLVLAVPVSVDDSGLLFEAVSFGCNSS